ncbi:DinB family protein [Paenibacillus algorifonticola]|uniref:DinB family protein n=1 Tax=Paenibacillus algorifonticola TaxID=684063 RepID=UPI003D2721CE
MNTLQSLNQFEPLKAQYERELELFTLEQLQKKPSEAEWSIGQVYVHLINSAIYMQLSSAEQCLSGESPASDSPSDSTSEMKERKERKNAIYAEGSLPPIRIHVDPSPGYTPIQPSSKEELVQGMGEVLRRMKELEPALAGAPEHRTIPHPGFGDMNAKEWFLLIEMHFRHHLRQLERLKPFAASI